MALFFYAIITIVHKHFSHLLFLLFLSLAGATLSLYLPPASLILLPILIIIWALSFRPIIGLYVLLFLYPFLGWAIDLSKGVWFAGTPFATLNAPIADFWGVILLMAVIVNMARRKWNGIRSLDSARNASLARDDKLPGFFFFMLFVLSALLSLANVDGSEMIGHVKYILRNIIFIYLVYVVLPTNI